MDAPVDFSSFETAFHSTDPTSTTAFPDHDVVVQTERRNIRTETPVLQGVDVAGIQGTYLQDYVDILNQEWKVVQKKSQEYTNKPIRLQDPSSLPVFSYSLESRDKVPKAERLNLMKSSTDKIKEVAIEKRKKDRIPLFWVFPLRESSITLDPRLPGPAWEPIRGLQMLIEVKELSFSLGKIEPFFGALALYDIRKKLKLSETYHFDINSDAMSDMLGTYKGARVPETLTNKAMFELGTVHSDVFLVLIVNKVLRGDEDDAADAYLKNSTLKEKERKKLEDEIKESCKKLGQFRQHFAWGAAPLFDDQGNLIGQEGNAPIEIKFALSRVKGDIPTILAELEKDKSRQKTKSFPGNCTLTLKRVEETDVIEGRLDPALRKVQPFGSTPQIREIREFSQEEEGPQPFKEYVNELYLYPESINMNNYHNGSISARNIAVEIKLMSSDGNVHAEGLPVIYGKSTSPSAMTTKELCTVFYHNKKPKFLDEIKIELPFKLNSDHHLLITFYHVQCQLKKVKDKPEVVLGYSVIPIFENNRILKDDIHGVPVALALPPAYRDAKNQEAIKWVDNKKPIFTIRTKLVSTVYTQDDVLIDFLSCGQDEKSKIPRKVSSEERENRDSNDVDSEETLEIALKNLKQANNDQLVHFFPVIMQRLFRIMATGNNSVAEEAFLNFVTLCDAVRKQNLLESYLTYVFKFWSFECDGNKRILHEEMIKIWIGLVSKKHAMVSDVIKYCWFIFGIINKSMILQLEAEGALASDERSRVSRFPPEYEANMLKLIVMFIGIVKEKSQSAYRLAKFLNWNVGLFLKDLLSVMNRGFVFEMIYEYVRGVEPGNESGSLVEFKFMFLKIVLDHEHYVALNLPSQDQIRSVADVKEIFWQKHFLAGVLLNEIEITLNQSEPEIRMKAIQALCFLLNKHDFDNRHASEEDRQKIAGLYFPYILFLTNNIAVIKNAQKQERRMWMICFLYIVKECCSNLLRDWWKRESQLKQLQFLELLSEAQDAFEYIKEAESTPSSPIASPLGSEGQSSPEAAQAVGSSDDLDVDDDKKGKKTERKKTAISGIRKSVRGSRQVTNMSPSNRYDALEMLENFYHRNGNPSVPIPSPVGDRNRKNTALRSWAASPAAISRESSNIVPAKDTTRDQALSREVAMVILDSLVAFKQDFEEKLLAKGSVFFDPAFTVVTKMLSKPQSLSFLSALFATMVNWIHQFKKALFRWSTNICGELCYEILRYCNVPDPNVRSDACALLFWMIEDNFKEMKNFSRVKLQCTIGISRLVGISLKMEFDFLKISLSRVTEKSKKKHPKNGSLGAQVDEMVQRLFGVLRDSAKMKEMAWDPERTAELLYQIALGFIDSPDLRVTWLESLASFHSKRQNFEECAQTKILTAALVSGYLKMLNRFPKDLPDDFKAVFPNLDKELILPPVAMLESLEGEICQSRVFTDEGFVDLLKQGIGHLKVGALHESCVEVYRLLLPIHQKRRDYRKQAACYRDLSTLCQTIVDETQSAQRLFSNYYRVAFYGKLFDDMNGTEYIYRENSHVRLADFTERLKMQFGERFGQDKLHVLPNLKPVNVKELDEDHAYLQIISVEISLTMDELKDRPSPFEQNFNLNRFIFETPFTKSGKAHAEDMKEQFKRKTILVTEAVFPYVKTRLRVREKSEIELTPIETNIELIERKTITIRSETSTSTPNLKTLHMILQGTLLIQVNAGPVEICRVFLGDHMTNHPKPMVDRLISAMHGFIGALGKALELNLSLIGTDQLPLHKELVRGYTQLQSEVAMYMPLDTASDDESEDEVEDEDDSAAKS
eukprot:TRINITY_DN7210_c0_g1_i1.p1 TRINITY_DN7210_c0_g1~~TRINITY_DN7210_c0_g1_i1.p1  ORF type:complete len:1800 (-),score=546.30 TRINITY_DN7210_c0_g1_i1:194-5593(-)